jgi:hypothetical protein
MRGNRSPLLLFALGYSFACPSLVFSQTAYSFEDSQQFLKTYCQACHQGSSPAGGFHVQRIAAAATIGAEAGRWNKAAIRVRNGEMPPKGAPAPPMEQRERFTEWVSSSVRAAVCSGGVTPGPARIRRLNRDEYAATIRDLFDIQIDVSRSFPAEGAGGEGFDNAGETLFLSPLYSEKYMDAARLTMEFAAREYKSRERIFVARPGNGVSAEQAVREILKSFLPRAFRRPVGEEDIEQYAALFRAARKQGQEFEPAVIFTLRAVLMSPRFLYLAEPPNRTNDLRRVDGYSLASRFSYFLWGSMPDELLTDLAAENMLYKPEVVRAILPRILRNERALVFSQRFVDQWLRTRELDNDKAPDSQLFPAWAKNEDLRSDIRLQPALFFHEILKRDLSVLTLLDSNSTIVTRQLAKHLGEAIKITGDGQQPQWIELPADTTRGGLLGMPAVLAVSSYPYRTSPVLRGAWILDSILGTPPPPPPANVPPLEKQAAGEAPKSVRELLTQHRANAACASCHSRIDPLGFALENYDSVGRWREQDNGKAVDNTGELPDGSVVHGPRELKAALLGRKDLFVRNLTSKMLGYALGRGLTLSDSCTVDRIVAELKENDNRAQKLLELILLSVPFQYQAPSGARPEGAKR